MYKTNHYLTGHWLQKAGRHQTTTYVHLEKDNSSLALEYAIISFDKTVHWSPHFISKYGYLLKLGTFANQRQIELFYKYFLENACLTRFCTTIMSWHNPTYIIWATHIKNIQYHIITLYLKSDWGLKLKIHEKESL